MSDIIQLTETSRLRVEQDTDATCPRDDYTAVGFVKIGNLGDSRLNEVPAGPAPTARIAEAHDHFDNIYERSQRDLWLRTGAPDPDELTERWAKVFHGLHVEFDHEHGGYWFVDEASYWGDVEHDAPNSLERQAELIEDERESYRQWADSEVYGVTLERRKTWAEVAPSGVIIGGSTIETWEEADGDSSIWGCYLDDKYTAQVVAHEYFELTDEEEAALGLPSISG